ncbi:MAG: thiamine pyrophosphate-binding protein [Nitrospinota bacterium]|nr:thiamine pyrophosphate-binding protein [Nitrospinota bacterium]
MLSSKTFIEQLQGSGFNFFTGVPCSLLSGLIAELEADASLGYIPSVREDAGVGLCAGAYMGGKLPVLLMQNSGLGYSLNAFTSLNLIYKIPVLVIMSWRGCGGKDAPEHVIMGEINEQLLQTSGMEYAVLDESNSEQVLATALQKINVEKVPYTLLVKKGLFDERH